MRPPSVYAKPSCPAGCPCDLVGLLHGPHRVGARLVMILLSHQHWPPVAIAELLGCDPATVRRWIHRYNQDGVRGLEDRPRCGRPRLASLHHAIGELPDGAVVLAEDETHINLLPWVRATWIANGTRQQVMTPGTNRRRTIFGAVDCTPAAGSPRWPARRSVPPSSRSWTSSPPATRLRPRSPWSATT
jgi:hypothetical protein